MSGQVGLCKVDHSLAGPLDTRHRVLVAERRVVDKRLDHGFVCGQYFARLELPDHGQGSGGLIELGTRGKQIDVLWPVGAHTRYRPGLSRCLAQNHERHRHGLAQVIEHPCQWPRVLSADWRRVRGARRLQGRIHCFKPQ